MGELIGVLTGWALDGVARFWKSLSVGITDVPTSGRIGRQAELTTRARKAAP